VPYRGRGGVRGPSDSTRKYLRMSPGGYAAAAHGDCGATCPSRSTHGSAGAATIARRLMRAASPTLSLPAPLVPRNCVGRHDARLTRVRNTPPVQPRWRIVSLAVRIPVAVAGRRRAVAGEVRRVPVAAARNTPDGKREPVLYRLIRPGAARRHCDERKREPQLMSFRS